MLRRQLRLILPTATLPMVWLGTPPAWAQSTLTTGGGSVTGTRLAAAWSGVIYNSTNSSTNWT